MTNPIYNIPYNTPYNTVYNIIFNTISIRLVVLICCLFSIPAMSDSFLATIKQQDLTRIKHAINTLTISEQKNRIETTFENGDTPLIFAAREGNLALFDLLANAGANPNARDSNGRDVLNIAVRTSNPELAKHAIKAGTDVTAFTKVYGGSNLIFASHQGEVEIVKMLITAGAPLDRINNLGWTALLEATILGNGGSQHQDIVKALLEAGANQSIADNQGLTPLDHAKKRHQKEIVNILSIFKK